MAPALQLRYVTVCLPGPPLNISPSHTLLRASPGPHPSAGEKKGSHNKSHPATSADPRPPSHSPPSFAIFISASQFSTRSFFFLFFSPFATCGLSASVSRSAVSSSVLPVRLVMGLKDACDEARCSPSFYRPSTSTHSIPAVVHTLGSDSAQSPSALMEGVFLICLPFAGEDALNLACFTLYIRANITNILVN